MKKLMILLAFCSVNAFATPVDINTADARTIADSLSGIGLKKAEAIVAYRSKNGAFKTIGDLTQVSGIGDKTVEKNKADILIIDSTVSDTTKIPSTPEPVAKK
ncbi:competence protein ComEA [Crenothrix sp. D3]|nr:competence protein ComEA [Crenothrix sp. D3]